MQEDDFKDNNNGLCKILSCSYEK